MLDRLNKTIDYYNQFNDNFPDSSYIEEVKKIQSNTIKTIDELKSNKNEI